MSAPSIKSTAFQTALAVFAKSVTRKFSVRADFQPEDQLKEPVCTLLVAAASALGLRNEIHGITEVRQADLFGRPDIGVADGTLLLGHIELKAPGKGADPERFKGADKAQWEKFKDLPNIAYTDGNQWALYRFGERIGSAVRLSGDITSEGESAVSSANAEQLLSLLSELIHWKPLVPTGPRALAEMLAPLTRLLRSEVEAAVKREESNLSRLAADWRKYLFPDADDHQFADAYAQTFTYALLLARLTGQGRLSTFDADQAVKSIRKEHRLLADSLKLLADDRARDEIRMPVDLLERVIREVDVRALAKASHGDPWLYFYEDFLAAYDPKMRKDRGVYFTPVPVVQAQVRLVAELLESKFRAPYSFADEKVLTLDPACGTSTYMLAAMSHALDRIRADKGVGMRAKAATTAARNVHGFEILVGPYAVAHLRVSQLVIAEGGTIPEDGAHVYLTDTLESPGAPAPQVPFAYKALGDEHERAQRIKNETPVLVCIGNPPYDRQEIDAEDRAHGQPRKGGWIRYGDENKEAAGILRDFIEPLAAINAGVHAKNLYNDYVYFWRWALWKVFELKRGPGIVSFITASSYLVGPGFAGMRKVLRETFDDLWIIDLEGGNLGARKTDNVFAIQTPVAIAIGTRYGEPKPDRPATVRYTKITGSQEDKFERLRKIDAFRNFKWKTCPADWFAPFLPLTGSAYYEWPLVTDIFPWQENGLQFKRSWPIGETRSVLASRWKAFVRSNDRSKLFKESRDRKVTGSYPDLLHEGPRLKPLDRVTAADPSPEIHNYAYRSFDRRLAFVDNRLGDYLRPELVRTAGRHQIFLTSLLSEVLGSGPAAVVAADPPDLHHYRGSFGGRHVIPLFRDASGKRANITFGLLDRLKATYKDERITAQDLFSYVYAVLAAPAYAEKFWDELTIPGPRIPITKDAKLFQKGSELGGRLIWLHTFGERFPPANGKAGEIPRGGVRCERGTPNDPEKYPTSFAYHPASRNLHIGEPPNHGIFSEVPNDVWELTISGFQPIQSWLASRMKDRSGKKSSPLDDFRPDRWEFDEELLNVLWILEHTIALYPRLAQWLESVTQGQLFTLAEIPSPSAEERERLPTAKKPRFEQPKLI